jgi:hypothetical protein
MKQEQKQKQNKKKCVVKVWQKRKEKKERKKEEENKKRIVLHSPGIGPGPTRWQRAILPLNYECFDENIEQRNKIKNEPVPTPPLMRKNKQREMIINQSK